MTLTAHRVIVIDAIATTTTAALMLATRGVLSPYFALKSPLLLDLTAAAFIVYAAVIGVIAARPAISRRALKAVASVNAASLVASPAVLVAFWSELRPVARWLIVAVAIAVEAFATMQFTAARRV